MSHFAYGSCMQRRSGNVLTETVPFIQAEEQEESEVRVEPYRTTLAVRELFPPPSNLPFLASRQDSAL